MLCGHCGRRFNSTSALQQHQKSTAHCHCRDCGRFFAHPDALKQHRSALHSFTCAGCNRVFAIQEALQQHQKSLNHCYCRQCDRFFVHSEALGQHLRSPVHATQFHCCDCDRDFVHEQALNQHVRDKTHEYLLPRKKSSFMLCDWKCEQCDRGFKDEKGLEQHRLSVIHKPLSDIKCVGSKLCRKRFTSPSAWLHHLESGACPSKMTIDKLNSAVQSNDIERVISTGDVQLTRTPTELDMSETMSITESPIFTPTTDESLEWDSQSGMLTPVSGNSRLSSEILSLAKRLTCPLCPLNRKPFVSLEAMEHHLSSSIHSPRIFHCPVYGEEVFQSIKSFKTLSGLMQHLESGACRGGRATFKKTIQYIELNLGKAGLSKLRLLK